MISDNASNKILVVDDDRDVLEMVSSLLIYWGHNVIACNNAQKAAEECRKGSICLIVSDVRMP
ncbi:MAG: response regulator, partial [Geobacteraceae bacterium]|nr:response regulator [Geobacteraceae bacterium]